MVMQDPRAAALMRISLMRRRALTPGISQAEAQQLMFQASQMQRGLETSATPVTPGSGFTRGPRGTPPSYALGRPFTQGPASLPPGRTPRDVFRSQTPAQQASVRDVANRATGNQPETKEQFAARTQTAENVASANAKIQALPQNQKKKEYTLRSPTGATRTIAAKKGVTVKAKSKTKDKMKPGAGMMNQPVKPMNKMPKGMHQMPDGMPMKDSEMKGMMAKKKMPPKGMPPKGMPMMKKGGTVKKKKK